MPRILVLFLVFLLPSCKKAEPEVPEVPVILQVYNQHNATVHAAWYHSKADFGAGVAPVHSVTLGPYDSITLDAPSFFASGQPYYLDWYSDDYRFTNWPAGTRQVIWTKKIGGIRLQLLDDWDGNAARWVLLRGQDSQTVWKAVGMHQQQMPAGEQYELTIRKDGHYTFDENGTIWSDTITAWDSYDPIYNGIRHLEIDLSNYRYPSFSAVMFQGPKYPTWPVNEPAYLSDTLIMGRDVGLPLLIMVRQP